MKSFIIKYCREPIILVFSVVSRQFQPFLGITLLSLLPAFLYGCDAPLALPHQSSETATRISTEAVSGMVREMDIFVFCNDRMQKLDCYQKVNDPGSWNHELISSSGKRIIFICANSRKTMMDWRVITSLSSFKNITSSLEEEDMHTPFMSGMIEVDAGREDKCKPLALSPLYSIININSIRCDFTGRPYAGERLEEVKVYLTNVNAECRILDHSEIRPTRIINAGRLREEDISMFVNPDLIFKHIPESIGKQALYPEILLICYPNNSQSEGPGAPFTRLVIEGKIQGETFYWPININRENGGYGIGRHEKYIYDLTITRKGTKDPDTPVIKEDIDIIFKIERWNEKEDCEVTF